MTQTIEQLTTRIAELEAENERLKVDRAKKQKESVTIFDANCELRAQLAAAQEEMNDWRNQAHQSQSAFDRLQDQLAKAEQLWQIAQGRCDGLEGKLVRAEQRVAEACALACEDVIGNTANDQRMIAAIDCSAMIHAGEWRKFVKEV